MFEWQRRRAVALWRRLGGGRGGRRRELVAACCVRLQLALKRAHVLTWRFRHGLQGTRGRGEHGMSSGAFHGLGTWYEQYLPAVQVHSA